MIKNKLILSALVIFLQSCSYFEQDLTLICKGKLHIKNYEYKNGIQGKVVTDISENDFQKIYTFKNKKYGMYKCEWTTNQIVCKKIVDKKDGFKEDNYFRVERLTGEVVQLDEMWSPERYYIEDFQGKCEKSAGNLF